MKSLSRRVLERLVARRPRRALQLSCAHLNVVAVELRVPEDSPLYSSAGGATVELPIDEVIAPDVLDRGRWQTDVLELFKAHAPAQPCVLLDIGANVGLMTRQLVHALPQIVAAACFEPHPASFKYLQRNLSHLPQCHPVQAAVGMAGGDLVFYQDLRNAGNYSLNPDAMRGQRYTTTRVRGVAADEAELLAPFEPSQRTLPIVWKSDTQGFDERIVTSLSDAFWAQVHCGVMEVSRIDRPQFDRNRLGAILERFAVRCFADDPQRIVPVEEVLEFSQGMDNRHRDVFFARS